MSPKNTIGEKAEWFAACVTVGSGHMFYPKPENKGHCYYTDSGRSSLRAILRSLSRQPIYIPDLYCSEITDVIIGEGFPVMYYHVRHTHEGRVKYSYDLPRVPLLLRVSYFGYRGELPDGHGIVIDDMCLSGDFYLEADFAFNSFRKTHNCVGGSCLLSKDPLDIKYSDGVDEWSNWSRDVARIKLMAQKGIYGCRPDDLARYLDEKDLSCGYPSYPFVPVEITEEQRKSNYDFPMLWGTSTMIVPNGYWVNKNDAYRKMEKILGNK